MPEPDRREDARPWVSGASGVARQSSLRRAPGATESSWQEGNQSSLLAVCSTLGTPPFVTPGRSELWIRDAARHPPRCAPASLPRSGTRGGFRKIVRCRFISAAHGVLPVVETAGVLRPFHRGHARPDSGDDLGLVAVPPPARHLPGATIPPGGDPGSTERERRAA